jgi:hypothetical protein
LTSIWAALAPYHPEELLEAVFGLFLAFFGGHYVITLAGTIRFLALATFFYRFLTFF